MRIVMFPQNMSRRFLNLLAIVGTLTFFLLLTVDTNRCVNTRDSKKSLFSREVLDCYTTNLDNNNELHWLNTLRNINIASEVISRNNKYLFFSSELLAQNISKYEQEWFRNVPEEDYLAANLSVFKRGTTIKNRLHYNFRIKGDNVCKEGKPFLLVIIPSVASNSAERDAIRWTWLRAAETNSWPRAFIRHQIKHIFLFGRQEKQQNEDYKQLLHESNIVGDIVMADFEDTYRNLTRKILSGLSWARQYCPQAQFVLKTDQDTFINVPLMMEVLYKTVTYLKHDSFVMGLQHSHNQPLVVRGGRWAVTAEEYPLDFFPRYLYGHTYVLNRKAVIDITDTAPYVPLIAPEDAFITGIVPKVAGVSRVTASSFTVCCRDIYDCEVVWNKNVALPEIKTPNLLARLWTNIITHQCNDTTKFIK